VVVLVVIEIHIQQNIWWWRKSEASLTFNAGTVYTITVGAGGAGAVQLELENGVNGVNSSISGTGITTITSVGGGGGWI
jgi:hypothetical protein